MITSFSVSQDLKSALLSAGLNNYTSIDDLRTWYHGSSAYTWLGTIFGSVKAVSDTATPRCFSQSDETVVRAWTDPELVNFVSSRAGYETHVYSSVNLGLTRRCTLTIDGENYVGDQLLGSLSQEAGDLEALGKAVIDYLNSLA